MAAARLVAVRVVSPGVHLWLLRLNTVPVTGQRVVVFADGTAPLYFRCDFPATVLTPCGEMTIRWPAVRMRGECRNKWSVTTRAPSQLIGEMVERARSSLIWLISPTLQRLEESFEPLLETEPPGRWIVRDKYELLQRVAAHQFPESE